MKRMLSGIKPSGKPHLGNYLGAILNFIKFQDEFEMFIFVADLHAITVDFEPATLKENTRDLVALYLACGLDPKKICLFKQSDIAAHSQLSYLMLCHSTMGELTRMTQFKDKSQKIKDDKIPTGLFIYPGLMAADILLYDADFVPVGQDQKQHIELTRTLANRMNNKYEPMFIVPEPMIPKEGAKIMSLQEPTKKMSKSDDIRKDKGCIYLLEDLSKVRKKIMSAITDTDNQVLYDLENKPGIANLMTIMHTITGKSYEMIETTYANLGYKEFKTDVADCVCEHLATIQGKYQDILNSNLIEEVLTAGALQATIVADRKIDHVNRCLGFK